MFFNTKSIALFGLLASNIVDATPIPASEASLSKSRRGFVNAKCTNPIVRKEWRNMNTIEKATYLAAVQCLYYKPSTSGYPGARNRYDDFNGAHIKKSIGFFQGTGGIHFVGHFLPWHRYYVAAYEKALREECFYQGAQPYWDWTQDSDDFTDSPVFDKYTGFGGNGKNVTLDPATLPISSPIIPGGTGGGCVQTGWFKNWSVNVGPYDNLNYNPRCLTRDFHPGLAAAVLTDDQVNLVLTQPDLASMQDALEGPPNPSRMAVHGAGHFSIGGSAGDIYSSSSEPLFFLHHAQIDRLWYLWQQKKASRLTEITGPIIPFTNGPNVTLSYKIDLDTQGGPLAIADLMNTVPKNGPLCYVYDQ